MIGTLPTDPRLPTFGSNGYERALYTRLYELFRDISQVVNALDTAGGGGGGILILGYYADYAGLVAAHPTADEGDAYQVGDDLYQWVNGVWAGPYPFRGTPGTPGTNGQEVFLRVTATHIQWRLGAGAWADLIALSALQGPQGYPGLDGIDGIDGTNGTNGTNGQEVSLQKSATHVQWRLGAGAWADLVPLVDLKGDPGIQGDPGPSGADGQEVSLQKSATHVQWRLGTGSWVDLIPLASLVGPPGADGSDGTDGVDGSPGTNGQEVSLQKTATHVQWRLGAGAWVDLIPLADLKGAQGDPGTDGTDGANGQEVSIQKSATHIQWRLGAGSWVNLVALADLKGDPGTNVAADVTMTAIAGLSSTNVQAAIAELKSQLDTVRTSLNTNQTYNQLGGNRGV